MSTSTHVPVPDVVDDAIEEAQSLQVRNLHIAMSMKRTIKVGGEFHSYESSASLTLTHPIADRVISVEAARIAGYLHMPRLVEKLCADLTIAGAMGAEELQQRVDTARRQYGRLSGVPYDGRSDAGDLRRAGDVQGAGGDAVEPESVTAVGDVADLPTGAGPSVGPLD